MRDGRSIKEHARDITIEQTVEVPPDVIPPSHHEQEITGRIERIAPAGAGRYDVAYVGPGEQHQLRNREDEPFGFYCIVDHDRDRPQPV